MRCIVACFCFVLEADYMSVMWGKKDMYIETNPLDGFQFFFHTCYFVLVFQFTTSMRDSRHRRSLFVSENSI